MLPMIYPLPDHQTITFPDGSQATHAQITQITVDGSLPLHYVYGTLDADGAFVPGPPPFDTGDTRDYHPEEPAAFRGWARDRGVAAGASDRDLVIGRGPDLAVWLATHGLEESTWTPTE